MNDAEERFVRWYAHLAADAPLDRHAARALDCLEERDRWAVLECLQRGVVPSARILCRLFEEINDA